MKRIKKIIVSSVNFIWSHKKTSFFILLIVFSVIYFSYRSFSDDEVGAKYFLERVKTGDIKVSVSGTGQVSSFTQFDVKPKVSGDIVYVGVSNGDQVSSGKLIAQLDTINAEKNLRDAEIALENAKISLEKLKGPDGLSKPRNKEDAEQELSRSYDDGFNEVSNAFLKLPTIISGLQEILLGSDKTLGGGGQSNLDYFTGSVLSYDDNVVKYKEDSLLKYQKARREYDKNFLDYKSSSRFDDLVKIELLIDQTYNTTKTLAESVKSASNLLQFHSDKMIEHNIKPQALVDTYLSNLSSYTGDTNNLLLSLLNIKNSIKTAKDAILNSDLDIRTQELAVKQKENAYLDAKENLNEYYIRVPFSGKIASVNVKKFDNISSGTSLAVLITEQKLATVSLNEVDISKVKVGQEVELTFDAVSDLILLGKVTEVDSLGTVSQGVVTYNVKISFDTDDSRIKSGMSVSASIVTEIKKDILVISNGAIKISNNGESYVEVFDSEVDDRLSRTGYVASVLPKRIPISVGISNDTKTEIINGVDENRQIIVRTTNSSSTSASGNRNTTPSLFGGGGVRIR